MYNKNYMVITVNLFLNANRCKGYTVEAPQCGASNEYPQCIFSWRNKKNINPFVENWVGWVRQRCHVSSVTETSN